MYEQVEKSKETKSKSVANSVTQKRSNGRQGFEFVDNRPEAQQIRKIQEMADDFSSTNRSPIQKVKIEGFDDEGDYDKIKLTQYCIETMGIKENEIGVNLDFVLNALGAQKGVKTPEYVFDALSNAYQTDKKNAGKKEKVEEGMGGFVSLDADVDRGYYDVNIESAPKINVTVHEKDFSKQSGGLSIASAVKEAIDGLQLDGNCSVAYSRHDFQDSPNEIRNLQVQLGGTKLTYRVGKGDTSCTLVIVDTDLFNTMKVQDSARLMMVIKAAHKKSYNDQVKVSIMPKKPKETKAKKSKK